MGGWELTAIELAVAGGALLVGSLVQGTVGFGSLLVAAPVLAVVETDLVPGPALTSAMALVVLIAWRDRADADTTGIGWIVVGRVPGTVAGGAIVSGLSEDGLRLVFASTLLVAVAVTAWAPSLRRSKPLLVSVGAASGVMGTTTSIGGPPVALLYQRERGPVVRGTLNAVYLVGGLMSLAGLALFGEFGWWDLLAGVALMPFVVAGFWMSGPAARAVDGRALRPLILALVTASGLWVLAEALVR